MNAPRVIFDGLIEDEFEGFDSEALFHLTNGTYWVQAEYRYWYHYAYRPRVQLVEVNGQVYLQVVGQNAAVAVRRVHDVLESRIDGEFKGWEGSSQYRLVNGQVWEQAAYKYEYKYAHSPEVLVYDAGSGLTMQVAGTSARVRRIR